MSPAARTKWRLRSRCHVGLWSWEALGLPAASQAQWRSMWCFLCYFWYCNCFWWPEVKFCDHGSSVGGQPYVESPRGFFCMGNLCSLILFCYALSLDINVQLLAMYANPWSYRPDLLSWVRRKGRLHSSNLRVLISFLNPSKMIIAINECYDRLSTVGIGSAHQRTPFIVVPLKSVVIITGMPTYSDTG